MDRGSDSKLVMEIDTGGHGAGIYPKRGAEGRSELRIRSAMPRTDRHYPLGFAQGATEIADSFGPEAEAIGIITILWNRHELRLKGIFERLLDPVAEFAAAAWEAENTHQGRMKLLRLAGQTVAMSEKEAALLTATLERTAALSEKRNALAHAEYVVALQSDALLARTRRRQKPPIYHPSDLESLNSIIDGLREVDALVGALNVEFAPEDLKQSIAAVAASLRREATQTE